MLKFFKSKKDTDDTDPYEEFLEAVYDKMSKEKVIFIKVEHLPQGSMKDYRLYYVQADEMLRNCENDDLETAFFTMFDEGDYLLSIVDRSHQLFMDVPSIKVSYGSDEDYVYDTEKVKHKAVKELELEFMEYIFNGKMKDLDRQEKFQERLLLKITENI